MFQFPRLAPRGDDSKKVILLELHMLEVVIAVAGCVIFALEASKEPGDGDLEVSSTTTTSGTIPVTDSGDDLMTTESGEKKWESPWAIAKEMGADKVYVYFKVISALFGFFAALALTGLYSILKGMKSLMRSRTDIAIALNLFAIIIYILTMIEGDKTKLVGYFLGCFHVFRIVCTYFEVIHAYEGESTFGGRPDANITVTMSPGRESVTRV